jgi:hypothetical protein
MTAKEFNKLTPEDFLKQDVLSDIFYTLRDMEKKIRELEEEMMGLYPI